MPLRFFTAGESHGPALIAILDGFPAGMKLAEETINIELIRRQRGYGSGGRMKIEKDTVELLSGVMGGKTTGSPISLLVKNADHVKWKQKSIEPLTKPRPGHADLTGAIKYGYRDFRLSLERSSARETTMRVAVGAICKEFLSQFGIIVGGYVVSIGAISADLTEVQILDRFKVAEQNDVRCPDLASVDKMREAIKATIRNKDTLGGILEIFVMGLPAGLGAYSQWDKKLEARLGAAILSVQAIKGVEFGDAWENSRLPGTKAHDAIMLENGNIVRPTNRAGGIEGGISNGEPIIIRAAMKPIATTLMPQVTVDFANGMEELTKYERSDFCPVPRAVPILEAMTAYIIADALMEKLGGDSMDELLPHFEGLRKTRLSDLPVDNFEHIFWE